MSLPTVLFGTTLTHRIKPHKWLGLLTSFCCNKTIKCYNTGFLSVSWQRWKRLNSLSIGTWLKTALPVSKYKFSCIAPNISYSGSSARLCKYQEHPSPVIIFFILTFVEEFDESLYNYFYFILFHPISQVGSTSFVVISTFYFVVIQERQNHSFWSM